MFEKTEIKTKKMPGIARFFQKKRLTERWKNSFTRLLFPIGEKQLFSSSYRSTFDWKTSLYDVHLFAHLFVWLVYLSTYTYINAFARKLQLAISKQKQSCQGCSVTRFHHFARTLAILRVLKYLEKIIYFETFCFAIG